MSDRLVVVLRQLIGLGGVPPLCPIALLLALGSSIHSASLSLRVLVSSRSLRDGVTLTGRVFLRSRSD